MITILVITWIFILAIVLLLFYYIWNDYHKRKLHEYRRVEISELAMIFQTLRDVVSEQKILAKEFNEQVEEKISLIRGIVNDAQNKMKKIQQEIVEQSQRIMELQEQIDRIICQKSVLPESSIDEVKNSRSTAIIEAESICDELSQITEEKKERRPTVSRVNNDELEGKGVEEEPISCTKSEEIETISSETMEREEDQHDLSQERAKLQQAYQSLIRGPMVDIQPDEVEIQKNKEKEIRQEPNLTPIQKMVLEYHQAGMTVNEISKELGITRGEVRLILSLAISKKSKT